MIPKRNFRYGLPTSNYVDGLLGALGAMLGRPSISRSQTTFCRGSKTLNRRSPSEHKLRHVHVRKHMASVRSIADVHAALEQTHTEIDTVQQRIADVEQELRAQNVPADRRMMLVQPLQHEKNQLRDLYIALQNDLRQRMFPFSLLRFAFLSPLPCCRAVSFSRLVCV